MWPPIALVAECTTRSTPWASGCCASGVAKVESTTVIGPAIAPSSSRSTRSRLRVGRGLGPDEHRLAGPDGGRERAGLGAVDEGDVDAEPRARGLQEQLRAGVELALGDDVVAGRAQAEDHAADRAHARRVGPSRLGALEVGHRPLEVVDGRVAVAGVEAVGPDRGGHAPGLVDRRGWRTSRSTRGSGRATGVLPFRPARIGRGSRCSSRQRASVTFRSSRNSRTSRPTWSCSSRNASWPWGLSISA